MNANKDFTKVVTGEVVLNYPCLTKPRESRFDSNSSLKYGTTIIIPKDDVPTIKGIKRAIVHAKLLGNFKDDEYVNSPLKDGDIEYPDNELYKNSYFLYTSTCFRPNIVDEDLKEIEENIGEYKSGTVAKVSMVFNPYNVNGNRGIAARLNNVQILPRNKYLELMSSPQDDFGTSE